MATIDNILSFDNNSLEGKAKARFGCSVQGSVRFFVCPTVDEVNRSRYGLVTFEKCQHPYP